MATNRFSALHIQEPTESPPTDTFSSETQKRHPESEPAISASVDEEIVLEDDSMTNKYEAIREAFAFIRVSTETQAFITDMDTDIMRRISTTCESDWSSIGQTQLKGKCHSHLPRG